MSWREERAPAESGSAARGKIREHSVARFHCNQQHPECDRGAAAEESGSDEAEAEGGGNGVVDTRAAVDAKDQRETALVIPHVPADGVCAGALADGVAGAVRRSVGLRDQP
jgi:hypothetical protein